MADKGYRFLRGAFGYVVINAADFAAAAAVFRTVYPGERVCGSRWTKTDEA